MQKGNAVMVTDKESDNDGNIGVIESSNEEFVEVRFNFFDDTHSYKRSSIFDLTLNAQ